MISIDPGVGGTGYAVWEQSEVFTTANLLTFGTLHFKTGQTEWLEKAQTITGLLEHLMAEHPLKMFVIEYPNFMQGSGGRMVAASGDLVKLSVLTGMLINVGSRQCRTIRLVSPNEWKGQLPKSVTASRIKRTMGWTSKQTLKPSDHALDAIGIGLWAQGRF